MRESRTSAAERAWYSRVAHSDTGSRDHEHDTASVHSPVKAETMAAKKKSTSNNGLRSWSSSTRSRVSFRWPRNLVATMGERSRCAASLAVKALGVAGEFAQQVVRSIRPERGEVIAGVVPLALCDAARAKRSPVSSAARS